MMIKVGRVIGGIHDGSILRSYSGTIKIADDMLDGSVKVNYYEHETIDGEDVYVCRESEGRANFAIPWKKR